MSQKWKKLDLVVVVDFSVDPPQLEKTVELRCPVDEAYAFLTEVHDFVVEKLGELEEIGVEENDDESRVH